MPTTWYNSVKTLFCGIKVLQMPVGWGGRDMEEAESQSYSV